MLQEREEETKQKIERRRTWQVGRVFCRDRVSAPYSQQRWGGKGQEKGEEEEEGEEEGHLAPCVPPPCGRGAGPTRRRATGHTDCRVYSLYIELYGLYLAVYVAYYKVYGTYIKLYYELIGN